MIPDKIVFGVRLDLKCKTSLLAVVHHIEDPNQYAFPGVVSLDVFSTAFFLGELNSLYILATVLDNAYLHEYTKEIFTNVDPELCE